MVSSDEVLFGGLIVLAGSKQHVETGGVRYEIGWCKSQLTCLGGGRGIRVRLDTARPSDDFVFWLLRVVAGRNPTDDFDQIACRRAGMAGIEDHRHVDTARGDLGDEGGNILVDQVGRAAAAVITDNGLEKPAGLDSRKEAVVGNL